MHVVCVLLGKNDLCVLYLEVKVASMAYAVEEEVCVLISFDLSILGFFQFVPASQNLDIFFRGVISHRVV